jgi:TatA/E family protein of Tat protein translocase
VLLKKAYRRSRGTVASVPFDGALSPLHWLIVAVVALLVIGPEQLPRVARSVAGGLRELRRLEQHLRAEAEDMFGDAEIPELDGGAGDPTSTRGQRVWPPEN